MNHTQIIVLFVALAIVISLVIFMLRAHRSSQLKTRFGPEYQRKVEESGGVSRGERRLEQMERRVERLHIRSLSPADRQRFIGDWRFIQAKFVDSPDAALTDADALIRETMTARGYPVSDFEQQTADLSVNHPTVVENYRAGHEIAIRHSEGRATTEALRQAMIHYRRLFDELVEVPEGTRTKVVVG